MLSKSAFARLVGVTGQAVGQATRRGRRLHGAVTRAGFIDEEHPAALEYIQEHAPRDDRPRDEEAGPAPNLIEPGESPDDLDQILALTVRQILEQFGGKRAFDDWIKSVKLAEEAREKRLKNDERENLLISREFVEANIFGALEELSRRLLTDLVRTLVQRVFALAKSNVSVEEAEAEVRDMMSMPLDKVKKTITRKLDSV